MVTAQDIKKYFWFIFGIMGVVFFWVGIWDGLGSLPYLENPIISFIVGILMLSMSRFIFKDADPFGGRTKKEIEVVLHKLNKHPLKHEFHIKYEDKIKKKKVSLKASKIKEVGKDFLIFIDKGKEIFVPLHRITEIKHKQKTHWKR